MSHVMFPVRFAGEGFADNVTQAMIGEWADRVNLLVEGNVFNAAMSSLPILPDNMEPCGKKWFLSKETADLELEHMHSIRGPEYELNSYYCFGCDGFHIGHTRIERKRR